MVYTRETTEMKKIINNPNAVVEEMLQCIEIEAAVMNRRMPAMSAMVCWMPQ